MSMGALIKELRSARGWSQGQLADALCEASGRPTITREEVSRWERGVRVPGRFWLPHLATVLQAPLSMLEAYRVQRRAFLRMATLAPIAGVLPAVSGGGIEATVDDVVASIAGGDPGPLAALQTSHEADLAIAGVSSQDRPTLLHLAKWMDDGDNDVLRVNAAGILAKSTADAELLDAASLALIRDHDVRRRYISAVVARTGKSTKALAAEVLNPRDSGARWCAAFLLGRDGSPAAARALRRALRVEPVRENIRTIGMVLNGVNPCT